MTSRQKGKAFETKIRKYLESVGYTVDVARPTIKYCGPGKIFSGPNDFWGCIDLIAFHPNKAYTLCVQAHAGDNASTKRKDVEKLPWNTNAQCVQVWTPLAGIKRGIRTYWLQKDGSWREILWAMKTGEVPVGGHL